MHLCLQTTPHTQHLLRKMQFGCQSDHMCVNFPVNIRSTDTLLRHNEKPSQERCYAIRKRLKKAFFLKSNIFNYELSSLVKELFTYGDVNKTSYNQYFYYHYQCCCCCLYDYHYNVLFQRCFYKTKSVAIIILKEKTCSSVLIIIITL